MTLRSSDLQSDIDLDSIRNSCDVFDDYDYIKPCCCFQPETKGWRLVSMTMKITLLYARQRKGCPESNGVLIASHPIPHVCSHALRFPARRQLLFLYCLFFSGLWIKAFFFTLIWLRKKKIWDYQLTWNSWEVMVYVLWHETWHQKEVNICLNL